ncbi:ABC transporter ATP-binding protein [Fulvivirga lutea]|uniref:ABC transporter ATP-binding protein n=1 Tax=Fulvivirga lutea TaxID=2810512 RepID=A0A975A019_9BACT|nr:ABC transporter ATP-binding protein [Fulvivirga lutea]QSE96786.1 ABC transporter ATP-binding protein [Fulvivirga lutea]
MLVAKDIHKSYGDLEVLKGVDFEVKRNEVVSITGASGAGKSTLLHILGTLDIPDKGIVTINDENVLKLNSTKKANFRNTHIGFIFQFHNLLPEFNALENVCIPALIKGESLKGAEKRASELLEKLGVGGRAKHKPSELSGGEQQRVSVARALINNPSIIFADEPSGNLDSKNAEQLHDLFFKLREELNQTFVIVTHNNSLAQMADRKLEMQDGIFI